MSKGKHTHIAYKLDAMSVVPKVARAAGVRDADIGWGLPQMWEWCWREKRDTVSTIHLRGFFGADVAEVLVEYGFLERDGDMWRVRGADHYLRITQAQSDAGKRSKSNLKQYQTETGEPVREPEGEPEGEPDDSRSESAGSFSDERTANSEIKDTCPENLVLVAVEPTSVDLETEVFDHWRAVMHKPLGTQFTSDRREKVRARLAEGRTVADLKRAIDGCARTPHNMGATDGKKYNDLGLICRNGSQVERFIENAQAPPVAIATAPPKSRFLTGAQLKNLYADPLEKTS